MSPQFQLDLADVEEKLALIPEDIVREAKRIVDQKGNRYAGSLVLAIVQLQRAQCLKIELEKQQAAAERSARRLKPQPRLSLVNG